jgi:hypothetical protein
MNIEPMRSRPFSRERFERNLNLLCEMIKTGRLLLREGLSVDGLLRVRYLPNRRADLLSVDESTRLKANMMAQMEERVWEGDAGKRAKKGESSTEKSPPASSPNEKRSRATKKPRKRRR